MRALHIAAKNKNARHDKRMFGQHGRRFVSLLLCIGMIIPMLLYFGGFSFSSSAQPTKYVMNRTADRDTMDDYLNQLLSMEWGSRYAGRIWTDKSVFAFEDGGPNLVNLFMTTDGYKGQVGYTADFLHVFSALASSQVVNEYPPAPIDLVIAVDMSASMAQDTRCSINTLLDSTSNNSYTQNYGPEERTMAKRIENSRIQKTLDAINETIDALMKQNKENRVSVVVYGAGAAVLMPLAHYARVNGKEPYLSVGGMETLYTPDDLICDNTHGWVWTRNIDACYTVVANAMKSDADNPTFAGEPFKNSVSNNIDNSKPKSADGYEENQTYTEKVIANPGYETWDNVDPTKAGFGKDKQELKANTYVGYFTNTQGGIYLAYAQLAQTDNTTFTGKLTTGQSITVARIPAAIIMSDGGANFAFNKMDNWSSHYGEFKQEYQNEWNNDPPYFRNDNAGSGDNWDATDFSHRLGENDVQIGDEWYNVYLPGVLDDNKITSLYNTGAIADKNGNILSGNTLSTAPVWNYAGIFYSNDGDPFGTSGTVLETLLTAAYMRHVTETHYTNGWDNGHATKESRSDLLTYTMSVDSKNVPQWGRMRLYPSLDPKKYSLDSDDAWWSDETIFGSEDVGVGPNPPYNKTAVYTGLKNSWQSWKSGNSGTNANFVGVQRGYIEPLPTEGYTDTRFGNIKVTNQDVINNISYADDFYDIDTGEVVVKFQEILSEITSNIFVPISGDNDAGVGDSITYQDPLGEYMEIKNQAITATTHGNTEEAAYDMALLLFGQMHGLVRAGVYDWNWNDEWMRLHPNYGQHGVKAFPQGWYKGSPSEAGNAPLTDPACLKTDKYGTWPCKDPVTGTVYNNAEEARADGWVMRFNFETLLQFVPIVGAPESNLPENLSEQVKNTVYTCYRFAGTADERNMLRMNPIFGDEVPEEIQNAWNAYYANENSYPVGNDIYAGTPGVYRNSDIRVWIEDTGDFVDSDGAITPNAGYDRSLYVNIPASAVPTQLATVTLGPDGVSAYQTNLATDKKYDDATGNIDYEDTFYDGLNEYQKKQFAYYAAQSTPLRLFYAVGLEEDLILRDEKGEQIGVDFSKISPEYITNHTVGEQNYVWFISNYYSATTYDDYASETGSATRGDPTMTFSPSIDNRYYIFQKPLPLYAHAYTFDEDGNLSAVDKTGGGTWEPETKNKGGNGKEKWGDSTVTGGGAWAGGEFMGTYENAAKFAKKQKEVLATEPDGNDFRYITDSTGTKYVYLDNGIIFLEDDLMDHVTSDENGAYTENSTSFSSDDYFFLTVEYYLPIKGTVGKEADSNEDIPNSFGGRKVQRVVARKGSEFGSGFASDEIDNGDMLCWSDMNGLIDITFEYMSKSDTDDRTRGEPTFEKLTQADKDELRPYLTETCGITEDKMMDNPDYNPEDPATGEARIRVLDYQVKYWLALQQNAQIKAALEAARQAATTAGDELNAANFNKYMQFAVAAKPGGIRSGDMASNVHAKQNFEQDGVLVDGNVTGTAENYYVPVVSENSGIGDEVILNNYMGNNGYLEIANQMLHVTKMLEAPEGFKLSQEQLNERFNYQIYVQGVTGIRNATVTKYNEYAGVWERELAYIDVLTDNSSLVMDNQSRRAVFIKDTINGSLQSPVQTAKMVVEYNGKYYVANEDGTLTVKNGSVDTNVNREVDSNETLYYLYLPSINTGSNVRRLYQNKEYDGKAEGYPGTYATDKENYDSKFQPNGVTTFVDEAHKDMVTPAEPGEANRDSYRPATNARPAGSRTYWAQDAELIPVDEVQAAENASGNALTPSTFTLMSAPGGVWQHQAHEEESGKQHIKLDYYNLVIRRPEGETSATAFVSPLSTRSQYMTVELKFGINSNDDGGPSMPNDTLTEDDLYDCIIPTVDRPDLFSDTNKNSDSKQIAAHTAEFTLRHGEGLLLTGLDNRIAYRFTEKLTADQIAKGYTLKQISHVQQRGSESIYLPGVQQIPIYTKEGSTYGAEYGAGAQNRKIENDLTWQWDSTGNKNAGATENQEPFAHTNAIMWEYYATMATGTSGNHHQPSNVTTENKEKEKNIQVWDGSTPNKYDTIENPHEVKDNPSCQDAGSVDELALGKCDVRQGDSILHYMYYKGRLIDPHYEGEASTYLRNMSRYGVSPTAHFGIDGETGEQANKLDYNGVYSVYGNTGWFEEQVNYTNTWDPDALTISKTLEAEEGDALSKADMDKGFEYTVTFTLPEWLVSTTAEPKTETNVLDKLYYWQGKTADIDKPVDQDGAPRLYEKEAIAALGTTPTVKKTIDGKSQYEYTFTLKADESIVIYGLPAQTTYTVTEKRDMDYPLKGETDPQDSEYSASGEIIMSKRILGGTVTENKFDNKISYVNEKVKKTGSLSIEKQIVTNSGEPDATKEFSFSITLTAPSEVGKYFVLDEITVLLTKSSDPDDPGEPFEVDWNTEAEDASHNPTKLSCTASLHHGDKITLYGIPYGSTYSVSEAQIDGYELNNVTVNGENAESLEPKGTIGPDESTQKIELLFQNTKAIELPLTGGKGRLFFYLMGTILLAAPTVTAVYTLNKKSHNA